MLFMELRAGFHQPGAPASSGYSLAAGMKGPGRGLPPAPATPGPPGTPGNEAQQGKGKGKGKAPSLRKAATNKLSQISTKLAEVRVAATDLPSCTMLPLDFNQLGLT